MSEQKPQLKLNLEAPAYIPKSKNIQSSQQPNEKRTSLSTAAKPFIPKFKKLSINPAPSKPQAQPEPEKPKPKKIVKEYFVIDEDNNQQFNFDYDYMISFENWEICQETKLLSEEFLKHLEDFKIELNQKLLNRLRLI